jgi:hypothetical protein
MNRIFFGLYLIPTLLLLLVPSSAHGNYYNLGGFWKAPTKGVQVDTVAPNGSGASGSSVSSLSWTHAVSGSNRFLVVGVALGSYGATITMSATYNGASMTSAGFVNSDGTDVSGVQLFYLLAPPVGSHTVQVTLSGGTADLEAGSISFTGVNQTTPVTNIESNYGSGTSASVAVPSATGDMVVDAIANGSAIASSGQTLRWLKNQNGNTTGGNGAQSTAAGASSVTMSYLMVDDWWGMIAMDIVSSTRSITLPTQLAFTTAPQTLNTWACSGVVTVQSQNGSGTPTNSPLGITVNLSGSGFTFFSDSTCSTPISSVAIASGANSQSFYFIPSITGSDPITAAAIGLTSSNQTETVNLDPYTWIGGAGCDENWATVACWAGGASPGIGNMAHFDTTCTSNCSASLSSDIDVGGIWMHVGYLGTLTQGGYTMTTENFAALNYQSFREDSGIFAGGAAAINVLGKFILTGGTFTSTGATLNASRDFRISGSPAFSHNSGTIVFSSSGEDTPIIPSTISFNNVQFASQPGAWITVQGTLSVLGDLTVANDPSSFFSNCVGPGGSVIAVKGNVTVSGGTQDEGNDCGANALTVLELVGSGTQTFSATSDGQPGQIDVLSSGTVNLTGTIHAGTWVYTSGTVNSGASTVILDNNSTTTNTINSGLMHFNNLTIGAANELYISVTGTSYVDGNLTLDISSSLGGAISGGTISLAGNFLLQDLPAYSGTNVTFTGGNAQTFTRANGTPPDSIFTVNKSAGSTFTLNSPLTSIASFMLSSGTVQLNGNTLNTYGSMTVAGANSVLQCDLGCGAGTACGQGLNELQCTSLDVNSGGTITP